MTDYCTHEPHRMSISLNISGSDELREAERLHGYALTVLEPNENINGVYLDTQPEAIAITQSTVRVTAPDGEVG